MSPHTDAGALLPVTMLVDATIKLNELLDKYWMGDNSKSNIIAMCAAQLECKQALDTVARQAASQGRAGGEAVAYWYERATARTNSGKPALWQNELTFGKPDTHEFIRNVRPLALSPLVKTGGEAEASNGGTTYSPIGRNADGIEVYKRDARPVDAGALEEIGPTGIEAAEIVADYIRLRAPEVDADDAANIIHILHEHGVRFALPKLTAVGESAAVAQASQKRDLPTLDEYRNNLIEECIARVRHCGECDCPKMTVDAIRALSIPSADREAGK